MLVNALLLVGNDIPLFCVACMQGNQDVQQFLFDPEIERTLRKLKKQTKASRQLNFKEVEENNMAADPRRTLGDYTIPSTASCGSSIVRPNVEANTFELKPSLIQLVQQEQF
ncbi:hypothetical protein PIB30_097888 [Stylosanthes scabra]|uniref:Uncharacterized protein n=1 Tax=Stylosanthes scabra TaxID=79078 RepID=A0ABU6ZV43_9FABA|nr:hypothetical protein [Stylosanthes scabra]